MQIHINSGGQQRGPFTIDQINQGLSQGALPAETTMAWYEGCKDWIPLKQVPGIALAPSPSTASPPPFVPNAQNPYQAPLHENPHLLQPNQGDATGGVIPYKNPCALIAYYLGIFGLIPFIGLFLAIPAFILGILGIRNRKRNPAIRGSLHAWIGIILGFLSMGYHFLIVIAIVSSSR